MKRFEYQEVKIKYNNLIKSLNELGFSGWELVVITNFRFNSVSLILKREKETW